MLEVMQQLTSTDNTATLKRIAAYTTMDMESWDLSKTIPSTAASAVAEAEAGAEVGQDGSSNNGGVATAVRQAPPPPPAAMEEAPAPPAEQSPGYSDTILLQGFEWESCKKEGGWYNYLQTFADKIGAAGFTHVWLPPPSKSVADQGYLPGQLYDLTTKYGGEEELKAVIGMLNKSGVKAVADIVINHRCADKQDENGEWTLYSDEVDHQGRLLNWGKWAITGDDPNFNGQGNQDTGENYDAAPDLDHANPELRAALVDWLNWLKDDIGFEGWRFDFAKGYAPSCLKQYVSETVGPESFCVSEIWYPCQYGPEGLKTNQDAHRQTLCNWVDATEGLSSAFDFTTKAVLQEAVKGELWRLADNSNKMPGMSGWWPSRACTFIDNHDTGGTQNHWPFPEEHLGMGYAYILTHPGIPCVFWMHFFDGLLEAEITTLIDARKRNGITAGSHVSIKCAESTLYVAEITGDVGKLYVKLGSQYEMGPFLPSADYTQLTFGQNYCIWEKPL